MLSCPNCRVHISSFSVLKFIRLGAIICPQCNCFLALDETGRYCLAIGMLSTLLFGILSAIIDYEVISVSVFIIGTLITIYLVTKEGRLVKDE